MNRHRQTETDRDPQKLPSTTLYYKACTKYVPVLLRTTMLAQSTSQYYFVRQSSQKVRPSTTSYYKARTKYFPVLLRTTKLAQSTSQYYFVLKSLHKVLQNHNITLVFDDRTSFRAKGLRPTLENLNFTAVFDDRTSFRAKGLHFVAPRWHCSAP